MIKVKRIDHVAIATADGGGLATDLAALFGLGLGATERVATQMVDATFLSPPAGGAVEIVASCGNEPVQRFVTKHGTALHHVCFEVEDLAGTLSALKSAAVPLVDEAPRRGARGHWVAFIHPRATGGILFELCQPSEGEIS